MTRLRGWLPWSNENPNRLDWVDSDDILQPELGPCQEETLTLAQVVELAAAVGKPVSHSTVRRALLSNEFPGAFQDKRKTWHVPRAEALNWLTSNDD